MDGLLVGVSSLWLHVPSFLIGYILKIIVNILFLVVIICVLNQLKGHWLLSDAFTLKKRVFCNLGLVIMFLNYNDYLQLIVFLYPRVPLDKSHELQEMQLTIYMISFQCNSLQLCHNNSFSTTMRLPYDYNHNVMLTSFFIHPSKFNMWHYEDFLVNYLLKY